MLIRDGKLIYHQTKLDNLESIIRFGLKSRAYLKRNRMSFQDVADPQILEGRSEYGLDNYVPFHFHPRTTFDYRIRSDNPGDVFIFLCMDRSFAERSGAFILPAHPLSNMIPQLYTYAEGYNKIDWKVMEYTQQDFRYNSQVRMAECLIENEVKIQSICVIFTNTESDREKVEQLLKQYRISHIRVLVNPKLF